MCVCALMPNNYELSKLCISCCIHSLRVQVVLSVHQVPSAEREQRVSVVETRDQALLVSQVVRSVLK